MRRRPRPISEALARFQGALAPPTVLGEVQSRWRAVAGDTIADHADPASERGGVITVRCASSVWATELTMLAPDLCERLNDALGSGREVRSLRFTVAPR